MNAKYFNLKQWSMASISGYDHFGILVTDSHGLHCEIEPNTLGSSRCKQKWQKAFVL